MYHPPRKIDAVKLEAPQKVDCKMQKPHIQAQDLKTKKSSKKANVYFWYDRWMRWIDIVNKLNPVSKITNRSKVNKNITYKCDICDKNLNKRYIWGNIKSFTAMRDHTSAKNVGEGSIRNGHWNFIKKPNLFMWKLNNAAVEKYSQLEDPLSSGNMFLNVIWTIKNPKWGK